MKIETEYWRKPVPTDKFDWQAIDADTYEGGAPQGFGATEQAAITDLLEQLEESSPVSRSVDRGSAPSHALNSPGQI